MQRRGFTVVELIITITILGILLAIAFVGLGGSQVAGRDDERRSDIETIATYLETFYNQGGTNDYATEYTASYPAAYALGSESAIKQALDGIDPKSLLAPGATDISSSFLIASNNSEDPASVLPSPTIHTYVYQPLMKSGDVCVYPSPPSIEECRKFNLYYRLESDNSVQKVTSKHQ